MLEIFQQISPIQWFATLFSLIYIAFAVKNNPVCWIFGIIGCSLWAYTDFTELNLKFDGMLQIFYIIMGFVGLYLWKSGDNGNELAIQRLSLYQHVVILAIGFALSFFLGFVGEKYLNTDLAYLDSITTSFSIIATILLVKRVIENWIYWIVFDLIYVYIYIKQEGYLFAIIMAVYIIMAIIGFYKWKKEFG